MPFENLEAKTLLHFLNLLFLPISAVLGWMWNKMLRLENKQSQIENNYWETRLHAESTYVKHDDYRADQKEIHEKLDRIIDKLSAKADR